MTNVEPRETFRAVIIPRKSTIRDKPQIAQIPQMIAGKWLNFDCGQQSGWWEGWMPNRPCLDELRIDLLPIGPRRRCES